MSVTTILCIKTGWGDYNECIGDMYVIVWVCLWSFDYLMVTYEWLSKCIFVVAADGNAKW